MADMLPTTSVSDICFGAQAWSSNSKPDPGGLQPTAFANRPCCKPHNGFFTSSWDASNRTCPWLLFLANEQTCLQRSGEPCRAPRAGEQLWLLQPKDTARLFVINSEHDYSLLAAQYPSQYSADSHLPPKPHWKQLATSDRIDGVHVTANAISENPQPWYAKSWSVESTLWFSWQFDSVKCLGSINSDWTLV